MVVDDVVYCIGERSLCSMVPPPHTQDFRPSSILVDIHARKLAFVLCNDQPTSFGAPDVLEVELQDLHTELESHTEVSNRPPTMGATCKAALAVSFLNNSSSRWDRLVELCRIGVECVDFSSPVFKSDRRQYVVFWGGGGEGGCAWGWMLCALQHCLYTCMSITSHYTHTPLQAFLP